MTYFSFIDLTSQVRIEVSTGLVIDQYFLYPKRTLAVDVLGTTLTVSEVESAQLVVVIDYAIDTVLLPTSIDINELGRVILLEVLIFFSQVQVHNLRS